MTDEQRIEWENRIHTGILEAQIWKVGGCRLPFSQTTPPLERGLHSDFLTTQLGGPSGPLFLRIDPAPYSQRESTGRITRSPFYSILRQKQLRFEQYIGLGTGPSDHLIETL